MYLLCFVLLATSILTECALDHTQPVKPKDYQELIQQGFATNYFKSKKPAIKYRSDNVKDVYNRGFRNLRLRSRADLYNAPYTETNFTWFLTNLTKVVDDCINGSVAPIISWIHHRAEANSTEAERQNYLTWWKKVADTLKDRSYLLAFNLFTELGVDGCVKFNISCDNSLRNNINKYTNWSTEVVRAIRATGGKNEKRILILGSPQKLSYALADIDESVYDNDTYIMVEWHDYAAGPYKRDGRLRNWSGNGTTFREDNVTNDRTNLLKDLQLAKNFTDRTGLCTYFGAWMPRDNSNGKLNQTEVINFARFFVSELKKEEIPWSLNVLDEYYDTKECEWQTGIQTIKKANLNMSLVLDNIRDLM